jgi:hypothetical protein
MHRKNRRPVGNNNQGVDLNRNFGPFQFWDSPLGGSSDSPNTETFRGGGPFSEPETAALKAFTETNDFRTAFNYHTFGNLLIHPYGAIFELPQDNHVFKQYAEDMSRENAYFFGTPLETVAYAVRGGTDDWMYGPPDTVFTERKRIISFTPEVGSRTDGFWPEPERILTLCQENLEANKLLAFYAGPELRWDEEDKPLPSLQVIAQALNQELSFSLPPLFNLGRTDLMGARLILSSPDSSVRFHTDVNILNLIKAGNTVQINTFPFLFSITEGEETARLIEFNLRIEHPWLRQQIYWKISLWYEGLPTSVDENPIELGRNEEVSLYPNPFSSELTIRIKLDKPGDVKMIIKNLEGKELAKMTKIGLPVGEQVILWAPALPSDGTYYLSIMADGKSQYKQLIRIK